MLLCNLRSGQICDAIKIITEKLDLNLKTFFDNGVNQRVLSSRPQLLF